MERVCRRDQGVALRGRRSGCAIGGGRDGSHDRPVARARTCRAHLFLGLVQIQTNRAVHGIASCEQALALDRNLAPAHAMIGLAKYRIGRSEETEAHIQEALRLSPRDSFVAAWLSIAGDASFSSAATRKRSLGFAARCRSTATIRTRTSCSPRRWRISAGSTRRRPRSRRDSPSIPNSTCAATGPGSERRSHLPGAARARRRRLAQGGRAGGMISRLARRRTSRSASSSSTII